MTIYNRTTATVRCKAFSSEGIRKNLIRIDHDGSLAAWDSVAGRFTSCHSIGRAAAKRILAKYGSVCPIHQGCNPADIW